MSTPAAASAGSGARPPGREGPEAGSGGAASRHRGRSAGSARRRVARRLAQPVGLVVRHVPSAGCLAEVERGGPGPGCRSGSPEGGWPARDGQPSRVPVVSGSPRPRWARGAGRCRRSRPDRPGGPRRQGQLETELVDAVARRNGAEAAPGSSGPERGGQGRDQPGRQPSRATRCRPAAPSRCRPEPRRLRRSDRPRRSRLAPAWRGRTCPPRCRAGMAARGLLTALGRLGSSPTSLGRSPHRPAGRPGPPDPLRLGPAPRFDAVQQGLRFVRLVGDPGVSGSLPTVVLWPAAVMPRVGGAPPARSSDRARSGRPRGRPAGAGRATAGQSGRRHRSTLISPEPGAATASSWRVDVGVLGAYSPPGRHVAGWVAGTSASGRGASAAGLVARPTRSRPGGGPG